MKCSHSLGGIFVVYPYYFVMGSRDGQETGRLADPVANMQDVGWRIPGIAGFKSEANEDLGN